MSWTKVAEPYPRALSKLIASSLCIACGWCLEKKLSLEDCARCGHCRVGEAGNPGPRRSRAQRTLDLHDIQLLSNATLSRESAALTRFLAWCRTFVSSCELSDFFALCPEFLVQALVAFGHCEFNKGGTLSNYRHLVLSCQRWIPSSRPLTRPCWDLISKWEIAEPVQHRPPIPEGIVKCLVSVGWQLGWRAWCGITLLAFYGAGRVGEVLKSKVQHMQILDDRAVALLKKIFKGYPNDSALYAGSPGVYRRRWDHLLKLCQIPASLRLTPGGLRGGAAVWLYKHKTPVADIVWRLRLRSQSTLESYLQETAALGVLQKIDERTLNSLQLISKLYEFL
eukprot:Skav212131  [mRNA]  locus=scaffold1323:119679:120781:- [translate_table: standard]